MQVPELTKPTLSDRLHEVQGRIANAASVATSTRYVVLPGLEATAFCTTSVTGCA